MADKTKERDALVALPEVTVTLQMRDGRKEITLALDDETYRHLEEMARVRNKNNVGEVILEALRLEQLLAERKLLVKSGTGGPRELVAV